MRRGRFCPGHEAGPAGRAAGKAAAGDAAKTGDPGKPMICKGLAGAAGLSCGCYITPVGMRQR